MSLLQMSASARALVRTSATRWIPHTARVVVRWGHIREPEVRRYRLQFRGYRVQQPTSGTCAVDGTSAAVSVARHGVSRPSEPCRSCVYVPEAFDAENHGDLVPVSLRGIYSDHHDRLENARRRRSPCPTTPRTRLAATCCSSSSAGSRSTSRPTARCSYRRLQVVPVLRDV